MHSIPNNRFEDQLPSSNLVSVAKIAAAITLLVASIVLIATSAMGLFGSNAATVGGLTGGCLGTVFGLVLLVRYAIQGCERQVQEDAGINDPGIDDHNEQSKDILISSLKEVEKALDEIVKERAELSEKQKKQHQESLDYYKKELQEINKEVRSLTSEGKAKRQQRDLGIWQQEVQDQKLSENDRLVAQKKIDQLVQQQIDDSKRVSYLEAHRKKIEQDQAQELEKPQDHKMQLAALDRRIDELRKKREELLEQINQ